MMFKLFWEGLCEATLWERVHFGLGFCLLWAILYKMCRDNMEE